MTPSMAAMGRAMTRQVGEWQFILMVFKFAVFLPIFTLPCFAFKSIWISLPKYKNGYGLNYIKKFLELKQVHIIKCKQYSVDRKCLPHLLHPLTSSQHCQDFLCSIADIFICLFVYINNMPACLIFFIFAKMATYRIHMVFFFLVCFYTILEVLSHQCIHFNC